MCWTLTLPMTEQAYLTSSKARRRSASLTGWIWSITQTTSIRGFEAARVHTAVLPELSLLLPKLSVCPWLPPSPVTLRWRSTALSWTPFDAKFVVDDDVIISLPVGIVLVWRRWERPSLISSRFCSTSNEYFNLDDQFRSSIVVIELTVNTFFSFILPSA